MNELWLYRQATTLLEWLSSSETTGSNGWTVSWVNDANSGYEYEEASAYVLSLISGWPLAINDVIRRRAEVLTGVLRRKIGTFGALSRQGLDYVFDTALGVAGLLDSNALFRTIACAEVEPGIQFVKRGISARAATFAYTAWLNNRKGVRWSCQFNPHLIKAIAAIRSRCCESFHHEALNELVESQRPDGAFPVNGSDAIDLHVHCYALEGLWSLRDPNVSESIKSGTMWLVAQQLVDGGFPRRVSARAISYSDITAQALRLILLQDRVKYASASQNAIRWLVRMMHPQGGIRYTAGSNDRPTWSAVFAAQAFVYAAREAYWSPI